MISSYASIKSISIFPILALFFFVCFYFWPLSTARGTLALQTGIELSSPQTLVFGTSRFQNEGTSQLHFHNKTNMQLQVNSCWPCLLHMTSHEIQMLLCWCSYHSESSLLLVIFLYYVKMSHYYPFIKFEKNEAAQRHK